MGLLTFPVQPFELLLELIDEVADGGSNGSQVEVGVDADGRPISGLRRGRQRRQVLRNRKSELIQSGGENTFLDKLETISTVRHCLVNL